jgi:predicted phosphohydrolase
MRLLLTADLHYNHARGKALAEEVIARINNTGGDVLVVIGDTAVADGDSLQQCLELFKFRGHKLFIAGNHELWTNRDDSYAIYRQELPRRVTALGWHWLEDQPFIGGDVAIVGSLGWYDYSFAQANLGIPQRFYRAKISPGAARYLDAGGELFARADDVPAHAMEIVARWNDGRYVKLHRSDEEFLRELLDRLRMQLELLERAKTIIAAIHHLPFAQLLPPPHSAQWDFAKAYLGSAKIGELLLGFANVSHVYCGHSHFAAEAQVGHVRAINIGSGYRAKTFKILEL